MYKQQYAFLYRRPRILNILHQFGLASPHSQMTPEEQYCLGKYASGRKNALEVGTYMGISAGIIATKLDKNGKLICVDPFEKKNGKLNPGYLMAQRVLKRKGVLSKTTFLLGYSTDAAIKMQIPKQLDFIYIDGDHSYEGLQNDWDIVLNTSVPGTIICLHNTTIPDPEPYRVFGSTHFFNDHISKDDRFELLETCYSMNVLKRLV